MAATRADVAIIAVLSVHQGQAHHVDVVVVARDNARALAAVLAAIPSQVRSIIVVDRSSRDATAQVARDAGTLVVRAPRHGYGAACLRAIEHLERLPVPPDTVVFVPGDGSAEAREVPTLLEPIFHDNAELVIGTRHYEHTTRGPTGGRVALRLVQTIYGHRFEDVGPFRAVRFPALIALGMRDATDGWDLEMQVKAVKLGLHIVEVPVVAHRVTTHSGAVSELKRSVSRSGRMFFHIVRHSTVR